MVEWLLRSVSVHPATLNWTPTHLFSDSTHSRVVFLTQPPSLNHFNPRKATIDLNHHNLHCFNQTHSHIAKISLASHLHRHRCTAIVIVARPESSSHSHRHPCTAASSSNTSVIVTHQHHRRTVD
ncbi:hypothetical protein PRUPE_3G012500 [Prunus persica]|uniref:Uncharacterized protein n=1 Tax=Prunus persica TaxID=3760 RepID=A0A251PUT2_PRUPE|nr:hypothetical protein PRUPE_3G012500 [Prunus persica]